MAVTLNASSTAGFVTTADTSTILQLQTNGTTAVTVDASQNVALAANVSSVGTINCPNTFGFKNRLINGAMIISQRNGTSSVSGSTGYTVDRWTFDAANPANFTAQQVSDAPTGFVNSVKLTTTTSFAATGAQFFNQYIEGLNVTDLAWGTASAQTVTVSFWIKTSIAGAYSVALTNSGNNYAYPTTVTVNSANTWEYKSFTAIGPTAGTWLTTNGVGLRIKFNIGSGATFDSTANTWVAADKATVAGSVALGATLNATLQITGVQFEKGTQATSFDFRDYGQELALCQRYFEGPLYFDLSGAYISAAAVSVYGGGYFQVRKRTSSPTMTFSTSDTFSSANGNFQTQAAVGTVTTRTASVGSNYFNMISIQGGGGDPRGNGYIWASTEL